MDTYFVPLESSTTLGCSGAAGAGSDAGVGAGAGGAAGGGGGAGAGAGAGAGGGAGAGVGSGAENKKMSHAEHPVLKEAQPSIFLIFFLNSTWLLFAGCHRSRSSPLDKCFRTRRTKTDWRLRDYLLKTILNPFYYPERERDRQIKGRVQPE